MRPLSAGVPKQAVMRFGLSLLLAALFVGAVIGVATLTLDRPGDSRKTASPPPHSAAETPAEGAAVPRHSAAESPARGDREVLPAASPSTVPDHAADTLPNAASGREPAAPPTLPKPGPKVGELVAPAARDVTPKGMTPGPQVAGPLTRVAGRPVPPPPPAKETLFHRVIIMDAGTIRTGDSTILIAGIEAPEILTFCTDAKGKRWPCGQMARTALRKLVRSRAIACRAPRLRAGVKARLSCSVAKTDLAQWLVSQGWAKAAEGAGDALVTAQQEAREAKRGLWR